MKINKIEAVLLNVMSNTVNEFDDKVNTVNISGINRDKLLEALWERSSPAAFYTFAPIPPPEFSLTEAKTQLLNDGSVEYVCGRAIKCNIYGQDDVNPWKYDQENGKNSFEEVVESIHDLK